MFNDLPSSRRGHSSVISFIFFCFFLHSFVLFFFANFYLGISLKFGDYLCICTFFLYFFFVKILMRFSFFFLEGT